MFKHSVVGDLRFCDEVAHLVLLGVVIVGSPVSAR